jgi:hypothetical protein
MVVASGRWSKSRSLQESPEEQVELLALGIGKHRPPADAVFFDVAQAYGPKSKQPVRLRREPAGDEVECSRF